VLKSVDPRLRRWLPVLFFFAGFAWDAITLGQTIKSSDLFILLGYLVGAAAILVVMGRDGTWPYLNAVLQFFFGGIFSALLIFYFLSSSDLPGYLVVLVLAALLVGNELLVSRYRELSLAWAFFTLAATMFFNFALAHLFRSISTFWFYLGTLLAMLCVTLLRFVAKRQAATIVPAIGVAAGMLLLHALHVIPPVPLVKKEMFIAHDVRRTRDGYVATVESPGWMFWRSSAMTFHRQGNERVYCFTSVFVPRGIATTIRHRWQYDDPKRGWTDASVMTFPIAGGRKTGYRGYTYKQNVAPGRWRVIAESEGGAAVGIVMFYVEAGRPERGQVLTFK
jgi:Protein of unknown function (DUF2914)